MRGNASNVAVTEEELLARARQYLQEDDGAYQADVFRELADRCQRAAYLARDAAFELRLYSAATVDDPFYGGILGFHGLMEIDLARSQVFADDKILLGEFAKPVADRMELELPPAFFGSDLLAPNRMPSRDFTLVYGDPSQQRLENLAVLFRKLESHLRAGADRCDPRPLAKAHRQGNALMGGRLPELKKKSLADWARSKSVGWMRLARVVVGIQHKNEPDWFQEEKARQLADVLKRK
jgi:hypothetical protein